MTKKRWIGVLLTAVMVFAMGAPCFADGILLPENEVEITAVSYTHLTLPTT